MELNKLNIYKMKWESRIKDPRHETRFVADENKPGGLSMQRLVVRTKDPAATLDEARSEKRNENVWWGTCNYEKPVSCIDSVFS